MRVAGWWMVGLGLAGCGPNAITITARVLASYDAGVGGAPAPGLEVALLDGFAQPVGSATTDADGVFAVEAPVQSKVFLVFTGEGTAEASFAGTSGVTDPLVVPEGQLFAVPTAEVEAWRTLFEGCPAGEGSGTVFGEVRIGLTGDPAVDPLDPSASVYVELADGTRLDACHLDAEGAAYAPGQTVTGDSGRFMIFGVPEGVHRVVAYRDLGEGSVLADWAAWVPDGGVVSLRPLFLPL